VCLSKALIFIKMKRAKSVWGREIFSRVPGGHKHWSGGDRTEDALFYEEGSGKFDTIPAK